MPGISCAFSRFDEPGDKSCRSTPGEHRQFLSPALSRTGFVTPGGPSLAGWTCRTLSSRKGANTTSCLPNTPVAVWPGAGTGPTGTRQRFKSGWGRLKARRQRLVQPALLIRRAGEASDASRQVRCLTALHPWMPHTLERQRIMKTRRRQRSKHIPALSQRMSCRTSSTRLGVWSKRWISSMISPVSAGLVWVM